MLQICRNLLDLGAVNMPEPLQNLHQRPLPGEMHMSPCRRDFLRFPAMAIVGLPILTVGPAHAVDPPKPATLHIDVPVVLGEAKVVFNMDHLAFDGGEPIGLTFMKVMVKQFKADRTRWQIVAVFHGAAGYLLLNDADYNEAHKSTQGNPYKDQIADLQREGVQFEECAQTAKYNGWHNADLLPLVKVNTGANFRIVQLVQDGFVQLQP
jgi:intracellular sulfur oxidation DsrE/DsrF family protein